MRKNLPEEITIQDSFFEKLTDWRRTAHLVVIASKPDIIKQAPLMQAIEEAGELLLVCHTGQHYDWNYSGGLEEEFSIKPDFNLNIKGSLYQKISQIIYRLPPMIEALKESGKTVIPYVHGDTTTAMASANAAYSVGCACVHVEAGLRTMTPKKFVLDGLLDKFDFENYYSLLADENNWEKGSLEPYPEQFNTRSVGAAVGFHAAPTELNLKHLKAEGYFDDRMEVVGNSVIDAVQFATERMAGSKIFEDYPVLKDGFIRFCFHRRENLNSRQRFMAIFEAMEELIKSGKNILLISLNGTEQAIDHYGLRERINGLAQDYPNFVYSPVWPYYTDVIAAMTKAQICATDSGSMQEEMNFMGIPCVTLRFNSDRPESIMSGGNILAPPINKDVILNVIKGVEQHEEEFKNSPKIYGSNPSKKIVDGVKRIIEKDNFFRWEHEKQGYHKLPFWQKEKMNW